MLSRKVGMFLIGVLTAFFMLLAVLFAAIVGWVSMQFIATIFFSMLALITVLFGYLSIVGIVFVVRQMSRNGRKGEDE